MEIRIGYLLRVFSVTKKRAVVTAGDDLWGERYHQQALQRIFRRRKILCNRQIYVNLHCLPICENIRFFPYKCY